MNREIHLNADVAASHGRLLWEIAGALLESGLQPESLVWSHAGQQNVRVWLVLPIEPSYDITLLEERLRSIPGVAQVASRENISELAAALASRPAREIDLPLFMD